MDRIEQDLTNKLINLKNNCNAISIKAEFEAEGTSFNEAKILKELTQQAGLEFTIKIGGCEAIKDLYETQELKASTVVAPMIESHYALKKFTNAINSVFSNDEKAITKFYINIETITGIKNINEIINSQEFEILSGITIGRTDLTNSMNLPINEINSSRILKISQDLAIEMKLRNKEITIGGKVDTESYDFFVKMPYLSKFETRKVIFNPNQILKDSNTYKNCIMNALQFEYDWITYRQKINGKTYSKDTTRLEMLKKQLEQDSLFIGK